MRTDVHIQRVIFRSLNAVSARSCECAQCVTLSLSCASCKFRRRAFRLPDRSAGAALLPACVPLSASMRICANWKLHFKQQQQRLQCWLIKLFCVFFALPFRYLGVPCSQGDRCNPLKDMATVLHLVSGGSIVVNNAQKKCGYYKKEGA